MKKLRNERVERIFDLIRWFEEFKPEDLDQIERVLLGLQYVDNDITENNLKQKTYRNIKSIKEEKYVQFLYSLSNKFHCSEMNKELIKSNTR